MLRQYIPVYNYTYTMTEGIINIPNSNFDYDEWQGRMIGSTVDTCISLYELYNKVNKPKKSNISA